MVNNSRVQRSAARVLDQQVNIPKEAIYAFVALLKASDSAVWDFAVETWDQ
jgi:hypothetical protein